MVRQRDAVESAMESALQPGRFIAWNQEARPNPSAGKLANKIGEFPL